MFRYLKFLKFLDPNNQNYFNQRFRQRRFQFFLNQLEKLHINKCITILDVGGVEAYWINMGILDNKHQFKITLLNLEEVSVSNNIFSSVAGDATDLRQFQNNCFDIVYSNSVIEHLFNWESQVKMAEEVKRVGKNYFIQTPNYWFPVEPHWLFPFFQFLPSSIQLWLTSNFDLGHYKKAKDSETAKKRLAEVKLLTANKMKKLFPGGCIYKERLFGLVKSITAYSIN
jgi:hypothetical protein